MFARFLFSFFFVMVVVAGVGMFFFANSGNGVEGWATFCFLGMMGSFLALMVTFSVAPTAFSVRK